jgi:hypothetical protein
LFVGVYVDVEEYVVEWIYFVQNYDHYNEVGAGVDDVALIIITLK